MTAPATADSTPTAILERISLVLDAFDGPGRLTLAQVVRRTGLPRSSAHRMLERLVEMRWLRREGRDYELGTRLMELGSIAVHQNRLHSAAAPILHELHRTTGYVVHLGVLDGSDVLYLDKVGGRLATELPTRVGSRYPAHNSAIGKALLAYTPHSTHDLTRLTPELRKVRETGVAYEMSRVSGGVGIIAAPIGPVGDVVAALSICGPTSHLKFDHRHAAPVRMAANAVHRSLTGRPRTAPVAPRPRHQGSPAATAQPSLQYA
ncbi:IclR family transcriptional regulator [Rhodococcus sp. Z13]|uniref:IclR family transcriptional regulator n=1 Tax=Rhodococcus sacchari TaxID=2962047 RepID=A0ACD4DEG9_9NOCA|nr:IclR family transcriptional regulator [Rhodococcus sp. Z13]UYP18429.1 IclR family transcriptional regulator [Rhodococcus sp. Z13]